METLGVDGASLPIIWDADFLYGLRTASGQDTYVLCEINVSSVFAIPDRARPTAYPLGATSSTRSATTSQPRSFAVDCQGVEDVVCDCVSMVILLGW
jgi:hypothetical protein